MSASVDDLTLSQLADGELPHDAAVRALLAVLDDETSRDRLRQHLQIRDMSSAWRAQTPEIDLNLAPVAPAPMPLPATSKEGPANTDGRHARSILVASLVGGLLVLVGVWVGKSSQPVGPVAGASTPSSLSTPGQRELISQVFAFHESVAGPLKGYAADEKAVELALSDGEPQTGRPVAVLLRLSPGGQPAVQQKVSMLEATWMWLTSTSPASEQPREYVIVCREDVPLSIPLPKSDAKSPQGRLYLTPAFDRDEVGLRYSLTVDDQQGNADPAVLAGHRSVGGEFRSLGEIALGDRSVRVEASAWPLGIGN